MVLFAIELQLEFRISLRSISSRFCTKYSCTVLCSTFAPKLVTDSEAVYSLQFHYLVLDISFTWFLYRSNKHSTIFHVFDLFYLITTKGICSYLIREVQWNSQQSWSSSEWPSNDEYFLSKFSCFDSIIIF